MENFAQTIGHSNVDVVFASLICSEQIFGFVVNYLNEETKRCGLQMYLHGR